MSGDEKKAPEFREATTRRDIPTLPAPPERDVNAVLAAANPTEQLSKAELLKIIADLRSEKQALILISEKWGICLITLHRMLGDRQRVAMMGVMAAAQAFNMIDATLKGAEAEAAKLIKKKQTEGEDVG